MLGDSTWLASGMRLKYTGAGGDFASIDPVVVPMSVNEAHGAMTYINPISGTAMAQAVQQEQLAADKTRQLRRQQDVKRNVAAAMDHFEHAVENTEEVAPVQDEKPRQQQQRRQKKKPGDDQMPHIDLVG